MTGDISSSFCAREELGRQMCLRLSTGGGLAAGRRCLSSWNRRGEAAAWRRMRMFRVYAYVDVDVDAYVFLDLTCVFSSADLFSGGQGSVYIDPG